MVALNRTGAFDIDYVGALNLYPFLNSTGNNLIGLMTLTYVPNYFDILPMYLVILGMVPVAMLLARVHVLLPMLASLALWAVGTAGMLDLPAEYWFPQGSARPWFFNPFCWQLIFFTGFSFMSGWLPAPPVRRHLVALCAVIVMLTVPFAWSGIIREFDFIREWRQDWSFLYNKTNFGILRFVHFLSLAYLAWVAVGPQGARLKGGAVWTGFVGVVSRVGTQSLAVFMSSMVLARLLGVLLDVGGRGFVNTTAVNLFGAALITAIAYFVSYLKREPWRNRPAAVAAPLTAPPARVPMMTAEKVPT
jgi:hypothetical protein